MSRGDHMGRNQKIITTVLWGVLVLTMVGVVVGQFWLPRTSHIADLPVYFPAAHFNLIDQDGRPVTDQSLRGHPYILTFIFTTCSGSCPLMSSKMEQLQAHTSPDIRLVSFTVDPDHDTPKVLKEYGQRYHADNARWFFLTGTKKQMFDTALDMKISVRPAQGEEPLLHSDKFLLVDGQGNVRGIYDSKDDDSLKKLAADAEKLVERGGRAL